MLFQNVPLAPGDFQMTQTNPLITQEVREACARTYAETPISAWHRFNMSHAQAEIASAWEAQLIPYFQARDDNRMRACGMAILLADKIAQTYFWHQWHRPSAPLKEDLPPLTPDEQLASDAIAGRVVCTGRTRR